MPVGWGAFRVVCDAVYWGASLVLCVLVHKVCVFPVSACRVSRGGEAVQNVVNMHVWM